jgi:predicted metal-dependent enzyme (double-stranded beta helix superfamily)
MSYSLNDFCIDVRAILESGDNSAAREKIRQMLERLLREEEFCAEYVGPDEKPGLREIYRDPDLHFCVLAYNMAEPRTSPPHDHGNSWAVYGQTAGYTDMTIWSAANQDSGGIDKVRTFRLDSGQAGLFDVGEIHSIQYAAGSKFVRITGVDMSLETRRVYDLETGAVREIKHVATGSTTRT